MTTPRSSLLPLGGRPTGAAAPPKSLPAARCYPTTALSISPLKPASASLPSCAMSRIFVERSHRSGKDIVPVLLETDLTPEGWLKKFVHGRPDLDFGGKPIAGLTSFRCCCSNDLTALTALYPPAAAAQDEQGFVAAVDQLASQLGRRGMKTPFALDPQQPGFQPAVQDSNPSNGYAPIPVPVRRPDLVSSSPLARIVTPQCVLTTAGWADGRAGVRRGRVLRCGGAVAEESFSGATVTTSAHTRAHKHPWI